MLTRKTGVRCRVSLVPMFCTVCGRAVKARQRGKRTDSTDEYAAVREPPAVCGSCRHGGGRGNARTPKTQRYPKCT